MKRFRSLWIAILLVIFTVTSPGCAEAAWLAGARSYCLADAGTGQVLTGRNLHTVMPPASTTKIMTALLAVDYLQMDDWVTVSPHAAQTPPTAIGLRAGGRVRVEELMKAALMVSANDAAVALAEKTAGNERLFAYLMTKKAWLLGAVDTCFVNCSGLPSKTHLSTAYDLFLITRCALAHPAIARIVSTQEAVVRFPGYPNGKPIRNTNRMLMEYPGALGVKTGTTVAAGKCLVAFARRKDTGLITVVLKSGDRYEDSKRLLNYGFLQHKKVRLVDRSESFKTIAVRNGKSLKVNLFPERDVWIWSGPEGVRKTEKRVIVAYNHYAPIKVGDKLGNVALYYNGEFVENVSLRAGRDVAAEPQGIWRLLRFL